MAKKSKPLIFISHINEEKMIGDALKVIIEKEFASMVDVFVSSIELGRNWFTSIMEALQTCEMAIVLASPESIKRPWINFESGAVFVRNKNVIPLCHSGIKPQTLPPPLSQLQGIDASNPHELQQVMNAVAKASGATLKRPVDLSDLIQVISTFEETAKAQAKEFESLSSQSIETQAILEITNVRLKVLKPTSSVIHTLSQGEGELIHFEIILRCTVQNMSDLPTGALALQYEIDSSGTWVHTDTSRQSGFIRSPKGKLSPQETVEIDLPLQATIFETWLNLFSFLELLEKAFRNLSVELTPLSHNFIGKRLLFHTGFAEPNVMVEDLIEQLKALGIDDES